METEGRGCDGGEWGVQAVSGGSLSPLSSSSTHCREDCNDIITLMGEQQALFERLLTADGSGATDKNAVCVRFAESLRACQTAVAPRPHVPFRYLVLGCAVYPAICNVLNMTRCYTLRIGGRGIGHSNGCEHGRTPGNRWHRNCTSATESRSRRFAEIFCTCEHAGCGTELEEPCVAEAGPPIGGALL